MRPKRSRTLRRLIPTEGDTLRAVIDFLEAQMALGNLVYIRIHPVRPFSDKFGNLKFAKVRPSQKGAPDLIAWKRKSYLYAPQTISFAIEVKSPTGEMSDDQKKWQAKFEAIGGRYVICRSIDEFVRMMEG